MFINIKGIDKAKLFQALFNATHQQGTGFIHDEGVNDISLKDAREVVAEQLDFDYFRGRVMKVNISGDEMRTDLFDRDNYEGAAAEVVNKLRGGESA